ncbi:MAG TPA: hypothetical protein VHW01_23735 [Polyangiaceae bacterium]|nr:hypothetical protein [Polyangiaceae bacterium]
MRLPRSIVGFAWLSLTALQGCSSSKALDNPMASAGASGAAGVSSPEQCTPPGYHVDADAIQVDEVQALLHDQNGAVVQNLPIQICGTDTCTYDFSDAKGKVDSSPNVPLILPAFKFGDGTDYAELAIPITNAKQDLGAVVALLFPSYADGAVFPKAGSVTNGDLTLFIDKDTSVIHEVLNYQDDSQLVFRTVSIPVAQSAQVLDASFGFELAYAVAPLGSTFCPPARLSLKNALNWDAGTGVEVFIQGLNADEGWAPYRTWVKVADASVSDDGSSIDTTSGGIPVLSSIAVRRK